MNLCMTSERAGPAQPRFVVNAALTESLLQLLLISKTTVEFHWVTNVHGGEGSKIIRSMSQYRRVYIRSI